MENSKKVISLLVVFMSVLTLNAQKMVGHRGSLWGVENTRTAFINGARAGYHALECDIKMTADDRFVVSHDDILKRVNPDSVDITKHKFSYLMRVPLSQVRANKYYEANLCSLDEYLDICNEYNCAPVVEIKWCTKIHSNNKNPEHFCYEAVPALMQLIEHKGLLDKVIILTSMKGVLAEIRRLYPDVQLQLLVTNKWKHQVDFCVDNNISIDARNDVESPEEMVRTFHDKGLKVNV